ncbi:MAG: glycerophosphoryl diester phosphodiesterase [Acidimicrobiaceae bacterium]|jgi:glycerophosphoryl diester phosphodiesterase|nr:glycerophosphoryl diester phosphodiesterase [Acidimicrobiaceae bacterium]
MVPPLPSLLEPPIGFAHRGAKAHAPENTLEAFALALRLGATGLESDVWCTADGVAVLDHDGVVGSRLRRRPIGAVQRSELPAHVPELADLYAGCGSRFELSLDVKDPAAMAAAVAVARAAGGGAPERLWLCHHNWHQLAEWRSEFPDVRFIDSTRLRFMRRGPERRAAQLADAGIDAVNLHESDWTGGLTTLFHRFNVLSFGWDAQFERVLDNLLTMGVDGVFSDHVDRMMEAIARR